MTDIPSFISSYSDADYSAIKFEWNGKHAAEFKDDNQEFRWKISFACIENPSSASALLLEHLFLADADWSKEAWGAPHHFGKLGQTLLLMGGRDALVPFSAGFVRSFDTFGACHEIELPGEICTQLLTATKEILGKETDLDKRKPLEAVVGLLEKIQVGQARKGWAVVPPATPITNVRVVWPRWWHKIWIGLASIFRRNAT